MESIFAPATLEGFVSRINKLKPDTQRQWGKMEVAQMLAHCAKVLEIPLGMTTPEKSSFIKRLFGKMLKPMITNEKPFQRNAPTDKNFMISDSRVFEIEKKKLIDYITRFSKGGAGVVDNKVHPFFGKMTAQEWSNSQVKHLDHHLKQFGV